MHEAPGGKQEEEVAKLLHEVATEHNITVRVEQLGVRCLIASRGLLQCNVDVHAGLRPSGSQRQLRQV